MVNPLVLLPLLTASTLNATGNRCYKQNPPGRTQLVSTTTVVCSQAINSMTTRRALDTPLVFGRSVKVGHKLPDQYVHEGVFGACVIDIDIEDGKQETSTWRDIAVAASMLRDECVSPPPHLGGERKAGRRQLLDIRIHGRDKEAGLALPVGSSGLVAGRVLDA